MSDVKQKQNRFGNGKSKGSVIVFTLFRLISNQTEYREEIEVMEMKREGWGWREGERKRYASRR